MRTKNFRFLFSLILLSVGTGVAQGLQAQDNQGVTDTSVVETSAVVDSLTPPPIDTLVYQPSGDIPPAEQVTNSANFEEHLYQHPTAALFKSMLVPGLGQFGNRKYVKATLIAGLEGWLIGTALSRGSEAADAREAYLAAGVDEGRATLYLQYDQLRKSRNKHYWFAGLVIFLSMFDAYVDAHLSGSPADSRNDNFGVDVTPTENGGIAAQLSYSF